MKNTKNLKKSKYFNNLDDLNLSAFLRCIGAHVKDYYKDELIVYNGDSINNLYIIYSGSARSYNIDIDGNRVIIGEFGRDSIFGLEYQSTNMKYYREYLKAIEDTTVIICDSFRFLHPCQNRCKRHIDSMTNVFDELGRQLINKNKRIGFICQSKTRQKVMSYLLNVRANVKRDYFSIPYNRQELADYLGIERSALSAELSKMKSDGLIDFDKNDFKILKK